MATDTLTVTLNGDSITYVLNGTPFIEVPVASVTDFNVDLGVGNDGVSVQFGAGYDFSRPLCFPAWKLLAWVERSS